MSEFNVTADEVWNALTELSESNEQIDAFIEDYGCYSVRDAVIDMIPSIHAIADQVPERILSDMMTRGSFILAAVKHFDFANSPLPELDGSPVEIANDIILKHASATSLTL